jgi:hypothetical protein
VPYIKKDKRYLFDTHIDPLISQLRIDEAGIDGNLNYTISRIVAGAFKPFTGPWRYFTIARAMAVFVCAALEFYRRVGAKREDEVIKENGDIPEYEP